jgi:hypothetical protein
MNPNTPNIGDAVARIRPNASFNVYDEDISKIEWNDTESECPTEEEILESLSILQEEANFNAYKSLRQKAYPSIGDQLDLLYHQGYEGWRTVIDGVKDQYPKPTTDEEG